MPRSKIRLPAIIAIAIMVAGCKQSVPEGLIQPQEMEDVLYDYHMAQAVSSDISYAQKYKKEPYKNYALAKHGIDEALFDSSLAWYSRHTSYIVSIYENLESRVGGRLNVVEDILRMRENKFIKTISADTVDLWGGMEEYALSTLPNQSLMLFDEKIDTTFHPGDKLVFRATCQFPSDSTASALMTTMALTYANDSTATYCNTTVTSRTDSIVVETADARLKRLALSFYITPTDDSDSIRTATINGIEFHRYHKPGSK